MSNQCPSTASTSKSLTESVLNKEPIETNHMQQRKVVGGVTYLRPLYSKYWFKQLSKNDIVSLEKIGRHYKCSICNFKTTKSTAIFHARYSHHGGFKCHCGMTFFLFP